MRVVSLLQKTPIRLVLVHWNSLNKENIYTNLSLFRALVDCSYTKTKTSVPIGVNIKKYHVFGCLNSILIHYHKKRFISLLSALKYARYVMNPATRTQ